MRHFSHVAMFLLTILVPIAADDDSFDTRCAIDGVFEGFIFRSDEHGFLTEDLMKIINMPLQGAYLAELAAPGAKISFSHLYRLLDKSFSDACMASGCAGEVETHTCVNELNRQLKEWMLEVCSFDDDVIGQMKSEISLHIFRKEVQRVLSLPTADWSIADIDQQFLPGNLAMQTAVEQGGGRDDCARVLGFQTNSGASSAGPDRLVHIVYSDLFWNFNDPSQDFIFKDLLGCLDASSATICIDQPAWDALSESYGEEYLLASCRGLRSLLVAASSSSSSSSAATREGGATEERDTADDASLVFGSCGPCHPPPQPQNDDHLSTNENRKQRVVLISSFRPPNWVWTAEGGLEGSPYSLDRLAMLRERWRPQVIVHTNEEEGARASDLMAFYGNTSLVLKVYSNHRRDFKDGKGYSGRHPTKDKDPAADYAAGAASSEEALVEGKSAAAAAGESTPTTPLYEFMGDRLRVVPIGYFKGFLPLGVSGLDAARQSLNMKSEHRPLAGSFVGEKHGHTRYSTDRRVCMASILGAILKPFVDIGGASAEVKMPTSEIMDSVYRKSKFVASPVGTSLDCYRHYEATLAGSVPIVEMSKGHPAWPWHYESRLKLLREEGEMKGVVDRLAGEESSGNPVHNEGSASCSRHDNGNNFSMPSNSGSSSSSRAGDRAHHGHPLLTPLPLAPLGWLFPDHLPRFAEEDSFTTMATVFDERASGRVYRSLSWPRFCLREAPWLDLARKAKAMGPEEVDLRRELNARWYVAQIDGVRLAVHRALG